MVAANPQPEPDPKFLAHESGRQMLDNLLKHIINPGDAAVPFGTLPGGFELSDGTEGEQIIPDADGKGVMVKVTAWVKLRQSD